ncbi:Tyrosinase [Paraburkholderia sabiae]|uniref:tyrosinase family protein n=1 Tax=Paraburkholderia sabiae TaxID=273251 RepID=UPI001CB0751F|nr:tyrosinase family protein [Paraburkholderia sabiae]CAG9216518.1 Tyrosinase [Paraburkholderia sabiae]
MSYRINRRAFLGGAASAITWATLPFYARAATTNVIRVEWQQFKTTPHYASFLNAVRTMQANTNAADPNSWQYWTNVHVNYCPHKQPYFLAWHRGYLYYLERQIRLVSGDVGFTLPYWDWFTNPHVPAEFTDQASGNPLYCPRLNTNVYNALDLSPWAASTVNFQRGTVNSFEEKFEAAPHNPVHNIIGNSMATMQSPRDPIFYLHHANVDRLWHAWALPDGRTMPVPSDPYWAGTFTYATGLTILKEQTYSARTRLGYDYDSASRPTSMPPQAQVGRIIRVQASIGPSRSRPSTGSFAATAARNIDTGVRSIGGVKAVALREQSTTARVTGEAASTAPVQQLLSATAAPLAAAEHGVRNSTASVNAAAAGRYRSIRVVFDDISLTQVGAAGGYYYNVYLNLPDKFDTDTARQQNLLGTFGAFEIAGAAHHGMVMLDYPATASLLKTGNGGSRDYYVTLERVDGPNAPKGAVINIGEIRVELSTEPAYIVSPVRSRAPTDAPY